MVCFIFSIQTVRIHCGFSQVVSPGTVLGAQIKTGPSLVHFQISCFCVTGFAILFVQGGFNTFFCPCCAKCGPLHGQWYALFFQYRLSGSTKPGIKFPPILCVCFPFQTQYFFRSTQRINKLIRLYRSTHFSQWINLVPNWN